jgi:uncharacterized repeat protein (TIGR01451 family)
MRPLMIGQETNRTKTWRLLSSLALALGLTLAMLAGLGGNLRRARADTYTVTNTSPSGLGSLREAILDANAHPGHDTIDFGITGAIVLTDSLVISDDLTVTGPGADQLDISGANSHQVFAIGGSTAVTITGLTVRDGKASFGGGVYVYQGSARLNGVQVISNSAFSGGGVYVYGGSATLSGTQVVSNSAKYGGGLYVWNSDATLTVSGGEVISNSASDDGGGVCVLYGSVTLSGTRIVSNSADYGGGVYVDDGSAVLVGAQVLSSSARHGGGVYVDGGSVTLSGTRVLSNSASSNGGGVHVVLGTATLRVGGGEIGGNTASGDGGGVYVNEGSATLSGTHMVSNSAGFGGGVYVYWSSATLDVSGGELVNNSANYGGGVYVNQGSATLSETQVVSNPAATGGGGVYVLYGGATLGGARVVGNSADTSGGGMHVEFGSATLSGTQVISNSADFGGGVYVLHGNARLNVSGGEFANNSASDGGGVCVDDGRATLNGVYVANNSVVWRGGGVYVNQGRATLNETRVVSNSASWRGGGIYVNQGRATLDGTQLVSNSAAFDGGGVYVYDGIATLNVSGGEFSSNSAFEDGGGVYVEGGSATLNGTRVVSNSASYSGGGVYVDLITATLNVSGGELMGNSASWRGGGLYVGEGIAALNGTRIAANDATTGSGLYNGGTVAPTTALTITGDIYQTGGRFAGSGHDLRVEGSLGLAGGDFYAPDKFVLGGPFTHTGGVYHQTRVVTDSDDVGFPWVGGVILNANGQDLGATEVALTAGADCTGVPAGEAVRHCYEITPANPGGRDAVITFFYRTSEMPASHTCAAMEAYRWTGAWGTRLVRDGSYGSDGRLCGPEPQSLRVTGVGTFSLFILSVPPADVRISKLVTPMGAAPGDAITYTLTFSNAGAITATGVVITDTIPISVTNTGVFSSGVAITPRVGTRYVWDVADLVQGAGGVIIITGALSDSLPSGVFTNTAAITTTATDGDITNNSSSASVAVPAAAEITVHPLSLVFGDQDVGAGATASQTVTITNDGGLDLSIFSISLTGSNAAEFKIESDSSENPLAPGSTRTVWVSFDPASVGSRSANLSIQSDDSDESTVTVALSGTGTSVSDTYTLTVSKDGMGSGTVSSTPEGINCGAACQAGFTEGTAVTLTAAAASGSIFAGWAGEGCSGTGACQVLMDASRQVAATFDLAPGQPGYDSTPAPGSNIDVGTTGVGSTISTTLTVRETGDMALVVTPTLSGADAAEFWFAPTALTILDGGAAQNLTIACTPSITRTLRITLTETLVATLTVAHNAPGSPAIYPLSCTGTVLNDYIYLPLVLRNS